MLCALTFRGHGFWSACDAGVAGVRSPDLLETKTRFMKPHSTSSHCRAVMRRRMLKRTRGQPMSPGKDLSEEYVPSSTAP